MLVYILKFDEIINGRFWKCKRAVGGVGCSFFFPKADKLVYLMINRASVPMWGIVGQSAGPPKSAGEKMLPKGLPKWSPILWHGSDFIYTKSSARPGSDFIYTKSSARPGSDFIYTKSSARPRSDFIYTNRIYCKIFFALRAACSNDYVVYRLFDGGDMT